MGFPCECGCGELVKGRFVNGHNRRHGPLDYIVDADTGCWVWQRHVNEQGYAKITRAGRRVWAHRWFYEQHTGPIPDSLELDHLCRTPACVNPDHLEPVTHAENIRRGKNAKLTREQADEIRAAPESPEELAARYGVNRATIRDIKRGTSWREDERQAA